MRWFEPAPGLRWRSGKGCGDTLIARSAGSTQWTLKRCSLKLLKRFTASKLATLHSATQ